QGKQIILAGGAGGLGSVTTRMLCAEGATVVSSYRHNHKRATALQDVAHIFHADLGDAVDRARLLDAAPSLYGLVIFAGNPARVTDPSQCEEALRFAFEANALGPILLAREAAERMRRAGTAGSIVLFSTMQSVGLFPGSTAYASSKCALLHAARILAKECR